MVERMGSTTNGESHHFPALQITNTQKKSILTSPPTDVCSQVMLSYLGVLVPGKKSLVGADAKKIGTWQNTQQGVIDSTIFQHRSYYSIERDHPLTLSSVHACFFQMCQAVRGCRNLVRSISLERMQQNWYGVEDLTTSNMFHHFPTPNTSRGHRKRSSTDVIVGTCMPLLDVPSCQRALGPGKKSRWSGY